MAFIRGTQVRMGRGGRFIAEITIVKVAILMLVFLLTYLLPQRVVGVFPGERQILFAVYLIANALGLWRYFSGVAHRELTLRVLFVLDISFIIYLSKYFALDRGMLLMILAGLVVYESLVVGRLFGFIALVCSIAYFIGFSHFGPVSASAIGKTVAGYEMPIAIGSLVIIYVFVFLVARNFQEMIGESEYLAQELADATIASELAKEEVVRRNQQLSTLLQISESLSSSLEIDRLFKNFEQAIGNSVPFDNFSLLVFDAEIRAFRVLVSRHEYRELSEAAVFPIDKGVAGHVYNRGVPYLVRDMAADPFASELVDRADSVGSLICVPLHYQDDMLGVLCLENKKPNAFSQEELRFVESISPLVAIAVNNVVSFQIIKTASSRDKLTNLYNYFAFTQRFCEMLETSHRRDRALTMILIDLDDFKLVNDTYGHLAGNTVLSQMGELFTSFFRRSDLVARYGGEEFAVVLNNTPMDIGLVIADALRQCVEESEFLGGDQPKIPITVSIGVSSTADEGITFIARPSRRRDDDHFVENLEEIADLMLASADAAMYRSKHDGKNRVTASEYSVFAHKNFTEYRRTAPDGALPVVNKKITWSPQRV
jgi:diguanylate cyclase (GGDEF)-like protein